MKRPASCSASFSITGWRPATMRISPSSENRGRVIAVLRGDLRQRGGDVEFGDGARRWRGCAAPARRRAGARRRRARFSSVEDLLFGVEDFALVVLQLRRGEALGVDQRLLALVIGRREVQIGFRDFDVVAEDVVEADFERLRCRCAARSRASICAMYCRLFWLRSRSSSSSASKPARIVAAVGEVEGGSSAMRGEDRSRTSGNFVEPLVKYRASARRLLRCRSRASAARDLLERPAQREQVARAGAAERDLRQQPLQIENPARVACAVPRAGWSRCSSSPTASRRASISARSSDGAQQALAQQAAAHAGRGLVEHARAASRPSLRRRRSARPVPDCAP